MVPGPLGVLVFSLVEWVRVCLCVGHSVCVTHLVEATRSVQQRVLGRVAPRSVQQCDQHSLGAVGVRPHVQRVCKAFHSGERIAVGQ